ncbi:ABC transporter substrate-binding protein [Diplocloster agilis]|uniref:Extracellular solute-binding protein n=1 Tax=Diplocloster agilis TaxID=2850323 RepID=A0A949JZY7_9FIRM|nr:MULTISPECIES: extracellular solute-binding protein [Lachnospiraceae]MBU9736797.1 extracellular solute-binding protein [Diplocloster agilis]MBU9736814.1 extracellular solute-binding protein [Diplocloster agilis]MCU6734634.1 extracellular solute-binding protein [Suonthocola fibrivorans]SCJ47832.1 maltose ABC transporter periplasmic protein [uncultured Clostridium sp.]
MKKHPVILLYIFLSILVSCIFAGCGSARSRNIIFENSQEDVKPQVSLTFFGFKYEALNVTAIENSLHGFMDQYPDISISYDGIKNPPYFEILEKRLATGNGDDVFMLDHARVLELGRQGELADLSGLSTLGNFSELAKSQMTALDGIYYLPTSISAFGLYCNLDLLKEHGQEVPHNLAEFEQVCDYFAAEGITPIVANNDISLKTVVLAKCLLPYYSGAASGQIARFNDDPAALADTLRPGFQFVERMFTRRWVDREETQRTSKTKEDLAAFSKGDQPFMLTGVWAVPRLRDLNPDFEFEVYPYPILDDGSVLVINMDTRIGINANSRYPEEAKQFVEYLTQNDVMWEFVDSQSSFSPLKENRLAEDDAIQPVGPYLTNGRSVIGSDDNLLFPIWDLSRECIEGMLEGDDADTAVSHMEQLLTQ